MHKVSIGRKQMPLFAASMTPFSFTTTAKRKDAPEAHPFFSTE
jgi:hypothetical protein